jgi:hypothetical protein
MSAATETFPVDEQGGRAPGCIAGGLGALIVTPALFEFSDDLALANDVLFLESNVPHCLGKKLSPHTRLRQAGAAF